MTVAKQSTFQLLGVRGVQIGIALFVLQQFAGINAVMYFSTQVFKEVGSALSRFCLSRFCLSSIAALGSILMLLLKAVCDGPRLTQVLVLTLNYESEQWFDLFEDVKESQVDFAVVACSTVSASTAHISPMICFVDITHILLT